MVIFLNWDPIFEWDMARCIVNPHGSKRANLGFKMTYGGFQLYNSSCIPYKHTPCPLRAKNGHLRDTCCIGIGPCAQEKKSKKNTNIFILA